MRKMRKSRRPISSSTSPPLRRILYYLGGMIRFAFFLCFLTRICMAQNPTEKQPLMGRTYGVMPYLEYGFGTDRLGGAKITFLDTAILMKAVDSTVVNYKIQLSANHFAWMPKYNFKKDSLRKIPSYHLANSLLISGDDTADYVSVALDEKLPYRSIQQINPSKIVVDIYGVTSNTNWITHRTSATEIKNVYHEQIEDDVYRVIIELNHQQHWGYKIFYREKKLMIRIKRQPEDLEISKMKIVVDAGHGGDNKGASGVTTGILEKNYTIRIAKELEKELRENGAQVFMTRNGDESVSMNERIEMAVKEDPHFLISIHLNSSVKDSIQGVSTYYRYIGFRPLTKFIQKSMLELDLFDFGNVGNFNFALSGPTEFPNCLVEVAFLSNKEDEKRILNPSFHKEVAVQIVKGIKEWLKACKKERLDE
jgi:N-acetylmuramoyl-L-alanine amidase